MAVPETRGLVSNHRALGPGGFMGEVKESGVRRALGQRPPQMYEQGDLPGSERQWKWDTQ